MDFGLIIHGGAWNIPDKLVDDHIQGMRNALQIGYPMLETGKDALDVVEKVIAHLEDAPTFDAGTGSFLNAIGEIEMDAIIATNNHNLGAVAALQNIRHPIHVARAILEHNGPVMLVGQGAHLFASQQGFEECKPTDLLVGRELERYHKIKNDPQFTPKNAFSKSGSGTVGAVALDKTGNIAVAVSTGGTPKKPPGRVGDTPLFGAGAYVDPESVGVAATGYGEDLIQTLISKRVTEYAQHTQSLQKATSKAIKHLTSSINGHGGVIALGSEEIGLSWNTPRMAYGIHTSNSAPIVGIEKNKKLD